MNRIISTSIVISLLTSGSITGHHSYGDYDRNAPVVFEGTVKRVLWTNPHVVLTVDVYNKGEYSVEWAAVFQLERQGISAAPVKEGDRLIITGSVNKDPEKRILTILREISRPADGWRWVSPSAPNPPSANK